MRIAVGSFIQESNSFAPTVGRWENFQAGQYERGQEMLGRARGTRTEVAGIMDDAAAAQNNIELVPLLRAMSSSSTGPIQREVYEEIRDELVARLRYELADHSIDGAILAMHGAMSANGYDDATGDVLRRVREIIGPDMQLVATLDLHANVTSLMATASDALVGYLTFPHVDLYETGERAMQLLIQSIENRTRLTTVLRKLPMIVPAENAQTTHGVIADLRQTADGHLKQPGILDISFFPMQPWMDMPDVGCSVVVVTDTNHRAEGERIADQLADAWWQRRDEHRVDLAPTDEAIAEALASDRRPWVLADSADAPSSGAPGDSSVTLAALLRANPHKNCLTNIVDPAAVARMVEAGVGSEVTVALGACSGTQLYEPIRVTGKVALITDGDFVHTGQGLQGQVMHRGRTVVLQVGRVFIVVMERACLQWDRELYRSVELEPADAQIVIVKSPAGFRADYEPIAAEVRVLDAPGVCTPNLLSLPFKRIPRPMYPFD